MVNCFRLPRQTVRLARSFALANAGSSMAAKIAIMAMTTSNSMSVKADLRGATAAAFFRIASLRVCIMRGQPGVSGCPSCKLYFTSYAISVKLLFEPEELAGHRVEREAQAVS